MSRSGFTSMFADGVCEEVATAWKPILCGLCGGSGWKGIHSENLFWRTLFGVVLWDIIFDREHNPSVWIHNFQVIRQPSSKIFVVDFGLCRKTIAHGVGVFQDAPLDFESPEFYHDRKAQIEEYEQ